MSRIQLRATSHTKNQGNLNWKDDKRLEWSDQNFKSAIITFFKDQLRTQLKQIKKIESLGKEKEYVKNWM